MPFLTIPPELRDREEKTGEGDFNWGRRREDNTERLMEEGQITLKMLGKNSSNNIIFIFT